MLDHDDVVRRLAAACWQGDVAALRAALDSDALAVCDSGGVLPSVDGLVRGPRDVAQLMAGLSGQPGAELTVEAVNGRAGLAVRRAGRAVAVIGVRAPGGAILLWVVLNPAKLHAWHRS